MVKRIPVKIKYFNENSEKIKKIKKGDWIDLRAAKTTILQEKEFALIPLGIAMEIPEGYEAIVAPRSSTFKNYGILQTNSLGIIDNSYCGDNDEWALPVLATRPVIIPAGDRIAQFRLIENQPLIDFEEVLRLENEDRNGFGSTGIN